MLKVIEVMSSAKGSSKGVIVIVGGSSGIAPLYKKVIEAAGYSFLHCEYKIPSSASRGTNVALVIVCANRAGHSLQASAMKFFAGAPIAVIRSAGMSMVRDTIAEKLGAKKAA